MKKALCICTLTLLLAALLTGCTPAASHSYSITDELTQQYELTDLRWQEGLFRAIAAPQEGRFVSMAGLQAGSGRLIVSYTIPSGPSFWLECHSLSATEQAVAIEQEMPLNTWMTNAETPEHRAELLLQNDAGQMYAIYLRSDRMSEEEMLRSARTVHVWLPGEADPVSAPCTDEELQTLTGSCPWRQRGDTWPDAESGTLTLRVNSSAQDLVSDGSWRLQRLDGGRWYDMDQTGSGLQSDCGAVWGFLKLQLPVGDYRLMLDARSESGEFTEIPYYFQSAG